MYYPFLEHNAIVQTASSLLGREAGSHRGNANPGKARQVVMAIIGAVYSVGVI